jgi:hypothetical protein
MKPSLLAKDSTMFSMLEPSTQVPACFPSSGVKGKEKKRFGGLFTME